MNDNRTIAFNLKSLLPLYEKDLQIYREFCIVVMVLIPILGGIYENTNPGAKNFVTDRIILALVGLSVVGLSYKIQLLKIWMRQIVYFFNFTVTLWSILVASVNHFSVEYVFSLVIVILASSVSFTSVNQLSWYFLLTISSSALAGWYDPNPYVNRNIFIGSIATVGLISFLALRSKLLIQKTLEISEELMKTIFNESADAMFLVDREKQDTVDCNVSAEKMFKAKNKDSLVGIDLRNLAELAFEIDTLEKLQSEILKNGKWEKELEFKTLAGTGFWGDMVIKDIEISDKTYHLARITDVTEKKKAHEEVAWLATFPENDPVSIIELSPEGKVTYVNPMTSSSFPDLEKKELAHPILCDIQPFVRDLKSRGSSKSFREVQYNQSHYHQNISLVPNQNLIRISNIDITARIRAEQEIIASELKNQALINAIPDLMFQIDKQGVVLSYKPAKKTQNSRNVIEKNISEIFPNDVAEQIRTSIHNAFQTKEIQVFDFQISQGNKLRDYEARIVVSSYSEVVAIVRDITNRKELDRSLIAAREAALETSRLKSEFVANISHELRTPLNGIMGFSDLLSDSELDDEQKHFIQVIRSSSQSLLKLINDLLDFSKIESGKLELELIEFNIRDCTCNSIKTLSTLAYEKGLDLNIEFDVNVPKQLSGDPGRLRQILVNLVSNSIKFTNKGKISITASQLSRSENRVEIRFTIEDSGIGIPKEKLNMIFYSFAQADGSSTREFGGTGLGLALTKQLVELMNGKIWVESKVGVGSKFHFKVKFDIAHIKSIPVDKHSKLNLKNKKVLVVDSVPQSRKSFKDIFTKWNMKSIIVGSGQKAILEIEKSRTQKEGFSYILIDANISEIDGFTLASQISKTEDLNHSMIMILSSTGKRGDAARCREIGISAYLTKPIKPEQLLETFAAIENNRNSNQKEIQLVTRHSIRENKQNMNHIKEESLKQEY